MIGDGIKPDSVISTLRRTIEESGNLPSRVNYLEHHPDITGADAGIKLPVVSITTVSNIRITEFNTDREGYVYDTDGNRTGRVFTAEYGLDLQLDIWTASGSSSDVKALGNALWETLYEYDTYGPGSPFRDADGNSIESIYRFEVADGESADDYSMTPSIRRWRQDVAVEAYHRFDTSEDYVETVDIPVDLSDDDGDGVISG